VLISWFPVFLLIGVWNYFHDFHGEVAEGAVVAARKKPPHSENAPIPPTLPAPLHLETGNTRRRLLPHSIPAAPAHGLRQVVTALARVLAAQLTVL